MVESLKNIFAVPELRKRVLFTLGLLAVYRIGNHIPTPGVNPEALALLAEQTKNTMFGLYDMFSGGNLSRVTIFALGIMPYISASIILQLLTVVWPYLERLSKEGELGRRKITQYTRYGTIVLSVIQSLGIAIFLERQTNIAGGLPLVYEPGWAFRFMTVLTLTTGTTFIMWLGEQITERGIGNGMSLIIFAGIVVGLPRAVFTTLDQLRTGQMGLLRLLFLLVMMVVVVGGRRLHRAGPPARDGAVRQARGRAADVRRLEHAHPAEGEHGRRHPGHLRVVAAGVPGDAGGDLPGGRLGRARGRSSWRTACRCTTCCTSRGIIFFAYFYTAIIFNPDDVAENMRKYGGFVPGIRPGKRTAEYIDTILTRITLVGRRLPGAHRDPAGVPDHGVQGGADPVHRRAARRAAAAVHHGRHERDLLLRRHVAADHRRRGDGHGAAGRIAAHHEALRQLHEEDADPRASWLRRAQCLADCPGTMRCRSTS